jgi:hypothetical protein
MNTETISDLQQLFLPDIRQSERKRRIVAAAIFFDPNRSAAKIAADTGVSLALVYAVRAEIGHVIPRRALLDDNRPSLQIVA